MSVQPSCLGFSRIGRARELKKALEGYWSGRSSAEDLSQTAAALRRRHWTLMQSKGITQVPSNDFSLYDHMFDTAVSLGAVPARYQAISDPLTRYFAMARGFQDRQTGLDVPALEMTKWFDTNYHYIVPELEAGQTFRLDASKILTEVEEARALGVTPRPVIVGPVTFLRLAKPAPGAGDDGAVFEHLDALLDVYAELLGTLSARGVAWVQLDEPSLVLDLDAPSQEAYRRAFERLASVEERPRLLLTTYFGALGDNLPLALGSGLDGLHVDLVRAPEQLATVLAGLPLAMRLSAGVVDGRNIWRTDLDGAHALVRRAVEALGSERVMLAPSCSLLHVPVDLGSEQKLDAELCSWLAFAEQKLDELSELAQAAEAVAPSDAAFEASRRAVESRRTSPRTKNPAVRARAAEVNESMLRRTSPHKLRAERQQARFALPPFPTTTIGSFPQTAEVRRARSAWRGGRMQLEEYEAYLREETQRCVRRQEALGLDVLVHGEFERNDMVEYFGESFSGFAFTENGWVQSYGSRCVKPPILFGDVARPAPVTVSWSTYAQSLTSRPMKGMLTGPVTMLKWSFVRDDQPWSETCRQVALALRDEVADLEAVGISMIQVDEPALREGLPLVRGAWAEYLGWAVEAFRLATSGVREETQIHTHMCYAEFGDILGEIAAATRMARERLV